MKVHHQKHPKERRSVEETFSQFKSKPTRPLKQLLRPKGALPLYHQPHSVLPLQQPYWHPSLQLELALLELAS